MPPLVTEQQELGGFISRKAKPNGGDLRERLILIWKGDLFVRWFNVCFNFDVLKQISTKKHLLPVSAERSW